MKNTRMRRHCTWRWSTVNLLLAEPFQTLVPNPLFGSDHMCCQVKKETGGRADLGKCKQAWSTRLECSVAETL